MKMQSSSFKLAILALLCLSLTSASHVSLEAGLALNPMSGLQKFFQRERFVHPKALTELVERSSYLQGRRLQQRESSSACEWDSSEFQCDLSLDSLLSLLEDADNSVSKYLLKRVNCIFLESEATCLDNGCEWYPSIGCYTTHEDFRDLHSAECLEKVDHLIDATAGTLECRVIPTEAECIDTASCLWSSTCTFDPWYYYYNIDAKTLFPDSYGVLADVYIEQIAVELQSALKNGELDGPEGFPTFELAPFDCPFGYEKIECDFVEAFAFLHLASFYCIFTYQTNSDLPLCNADDYCEVDSDNLEVPCRAAQSVRLKTFAQAYQVFANGIEDPEARKYESNYYQCLFAADEASCTENCRWIPDEEQCVLSEVWSNEEIGSLVEKGDDPVCGYFRLDLDSGCVYREDQEECEADDKCIFSEAGYCTTGGIHSIEYAIQASELNGTYTATRNECREAESQLECLDIELVNGVVDEPKEGPGEGIESSQSGTDDTVEAAPSIGADEDEGLEKYFDSDVPSGAETISDDKEEETTTEGEEEPTNETGGVIAFNISTLFGPGFG